MSQATRPRCLLVEDQVLIAMAIEASLDEAGFDIVGPFAAAEAALASLAAETPDVAIIDLLLGGKPCSEVARTLQARGVPFVVYSGIPAAAGMSPEFAGAPWIEKPAPRHALVDMIRRMVRSAPAMDPPASSAALFRDGFRSGQAIPI